MSRPRGLCVSYGPTPSRESYNTPTHFLTFSSFYRTDDAPAPRPRNLPGPSLEEGFVRSRLMEEMNEIRNRIVSSEAENEVSRNENRKLSHGNRALADENHALAEENRRLQRKEDEVKEQWEASQKFVNPA